MGPTVTWYVHSSEIFISTSEFYSENSIAIKYVKKKWSGEDRGGINPASNWDNYHACPNPILGGGGVGHVTPVLDPRYC